MQKTVSMFVLISALVFAACGSNAENPKKEATVMKIENIAPESMNKDLGHLFVEAKKVTNPNNLLYISGQVGIRKDGSVGEDCKTQLDIAWGNVDAVLADAGMKRTDIVEVFVFVNGAERHDVEANKKLFADSSIEFFGKNPPAMSALVSAGLWSDDLCFEFKLVAAD